MVGGAVAVGVVCSSTDNSVEPMKLHESVIRTVQELPLHTVFYKIKKQKRLFPPQD